VDLTKQFDEINRISRAQLARAAVLAATSTKAALGETCSVWTPTSAALARVGVVKASSPVDPAADPLPGT